VIAEEVAQQDIGVQKWRGHDRCRSTAFAAIASSAVRRSSSADSGGPAVA
jgi:hypothetical protein